MVATTPPSSSVRAISSPREFASSSLTESVIGMLHTRPLERRMVSTTDS
jgi:hypothetical protein